MSGSQRGPAIPGQEIMAQTESDPPRRDSSHQLIFTALHRGPHLTFPCDADGIVDMSQLSERAKDNYLRARATVGRDFSSPVVAICKPED